jgi:uncharacterized protein (DUF58 family)
MALLTVLTVLSLLDYTLLFLTGGSLETKRIVAPKLSLGHVNKVSLELHNRYPYTIRLQIIDELPEQFQERDFSLYTKLKHDSSVVLDYNLRPLSRGHYHFGAVLCFVESPLRFFQRKVSAAPETTVKVYPAFHDLRKFQLLAMSESNVSGEKKIRRLGNSLEFEKIKDYVPGDDIRDINWKATARRNTLMLNTYTDARQQQVYCVIDKGRTMKMPFDGLTLLDYAINASLALLNVVLLKQDKAGLITFTKDETEIWPAERRNNQFFHIQEALFHQKTDFRESDYNSLRRDIRGKIGQRSFLLLFTNFETMAALERQLPYLRYIAGQHLLCVVFFENTMLRQIREREARSVKDIYIKTIADRFDFEKKQIVKELRRHGILSILSTPKNLSTDVINKYLELKSRQMV